jgi:predicted nucleic acid-binding Zn ribbon protein
MFYDLKSLLQRSLRQKGIAGVVTAIQVTAAFRAVVAEMFSQQIANGLRQVSLHGDTLKISAGSSALAAEMRMREQALLQALHAKLPGHNYRLQIFG